MDPNKKEELIKKLEAANAHKAELDARKKDMIERGAVVNKGLKEVDKQQSKTSVKNQLYDYNNFILQLKREHKALSDTSEHKTVFKGKGICLKLLKEYCAGAGAGAGAAVGMAAAAAAADDEDAAVGMAAAAAADDEDAAVGMAAAAAAEDDEDAAVGAAVSIIDRIGQCFKESVKTLNDKISTGTTTTSVRYNTFVTKMLTLSNLSKTIKEKEVLLLETIKSIREDKANEMFFGNLDTIRKNHEKSVLL